MEILTCRESGVENLCTDMDESLKRVILCFVLSISVRSTTRKVQVDVGKRALNAYHHQQIDSQKMWWFHLWIHSICTISVNNVIDCVCENWCRRKMNRSSTIDWLRTHWFWMNALSWLGMGELLCQSMYRGSNDAHLFSCDCNCNFKLEPHSPIHYYF